MRPAETAFASSMRSRQNAGIGRRSLAFLVFAHYGGEECSRIHAVGRIMRARINAAWFGMIVAKVAGCRLAPHASLLMFSRTRAQFFQLKAVSISVERMHRDVAVRAIVGAHAAADAPVLN